jgi:methylenetetrahydrofolate reductase (NADPH)
MENRLLDRPSIEVLPRDEKALAALKEAMPPGTEVFVTFLPQESVLRTVEICARLNAAGFTPVPHVAARGFPGVDVLDDYLARARDAGVERVLVIAGDIDAPRGPFAQSLDLLKTGLLARHGINSVAFAGHPEGHPKAPDNVMEEALRAKLAFARANGFAARIVTQFCFEAAPILSWLARMRAAGLDAPVHIGVAGPAGATTLMKYAMRCGVGNSLRALKTQASRIGALLGDTGPDQVVKDLAASPMALTNVAGLHIFPFGGVDKAGAWLRAAAANAPSHAEGRATS